MSGKKKSQKTCTFILLYDLLLHTRKIQIVERIIIMYNIYGMYSTGNVEKFIVRFPIYPRTL